MSDKTEKRTIKISANCILILLLVLAPGLAASSLLNRVLLAVLIPMFCIINAFDIEKYDVVSSLDKSFNELMKPYFVICIIEALINVFALRGTDEGFNLFLSVMNGMVGGMSNSAEYFTNFPLVGTVWVLPCLFICKNLYVGVRQYFSNKHGIFPAILIVLLSIGGAYAGSHVGFFPWSLDLAFALLICMYVGDEISKRDFFNSKIVKYIVAGISLVVSVLCIYKNYLADYFSREFSFYPVSVIGSIAVVVVILVLFDLVTRIKFFDTIFRFAGKHFNIFFAVCCVFDRFLDWNEKIYTKYNVPNNWIVTYLVRLLVVIAVSMIIVGLWKLSRIIDNRIEIADSKSQTKREEWADVGKGICMLAIILGHLGLSYFNKIVFSFDLPFFFVVAGYYLKKKDNIEFAKGKARRLLVPYFATCVAQIPVTIAIRYYFKEKTLYSANDFYILYSKTFYGAGDGYDEPFKIYSAGALWFLLALFFALIITHYFLDKKYSGLFIGLIAYLGWGSFNETKVWLPLSIQAGMLASLYVYAGYLIKQNGYFKKNVHPVIRGAVILIWLWSMHFFKSFWLVHNSMGHGFVDFITSLCAAYVVYMVSNWICDKAKLLKKILAYYGKNSLIALCVHLLELSLFPWWRVRDWLQNEKTLSLDEAKMVTFVIKIAISVVAIVLITNIRPLAKIFDPNAPKPKWYKFLPAKKA